MATPYQTLGVPETASHEQIRSAYRELAKKLHPDLNPGNKSAEQRFKEVSAAYERIGTPENRAKHDRGEGEQERFSPGRRGPYYHQTQREDDGRGRRYSFSFEDFADLFDGAGRGEGIDERINDEHYRMEIELRDSVLGAERELSLPTGKKLSVRIPAGVHEGSRLRFAGQGVARAGGKAGDVFVEIHVRPDRRFRQQGPDLLIEAPITLAQAVLGGEARVPTLEGEVMLRIPKRSNTGTRLRLARKGAYDRVGGSRGDQLVILKVVLPERIDPALEEAIRQWSQRDPLGAGTERSAA